MKRNIDEASILITGINGSAAQLLLNHIKRKHPKTRISGIARTSYKPTFDAEIDFYECDLGESQAVLDIIRKNKFDYIFHLASMASVRNSFFNPYTTLSNNIFSTLNVLEAVKLTNSKARLIISSTSEVYGNNSKTEKLSEDSPMVPLSPYAISKSCQDLLANYYAVVSDMDVIRIRMFSYINPIRVELFATSWADQISKIELGKLKHLTHGDLRPERALLSTEDAMEAYLLSATRAKSGEAYNVGLDKKMTVGEILQRMINLTDKHIHCEVDENLLRPSDIFHQVSNSTKFINDTGWAPTNDLDSSLKKSLDYRRMINSI